MLVTWTLVAAVVVGVVLKFVRRKKYNLPPGPLGLPFIGNVFQLDKTGPHKTLTKWSEEYGDVFKMKMFGRTVVVLNSFETIYEGLVTQANQFAGRPPFPRIQTFLQNCPEIATGNFTQEWIYRKKTAMQVMKMYGDNLVNLEAITLDLIQEMLEDLRLQSNKGAIDAYPFYIKCTTGIITSILFGKRASNDTVETSLKVNERIGTLIQPTGIYLILDLVPWLRNIPHKVNRDLLELAECTRAIIDKEITERKAEFEPGRAECFIDGLFEHQLKGEEKNPDMMLTDSEIYGLAIDLLIAGTNTTSTSLNAIMAVLVNKPNIQKQLAAEIKEELGGRVPHLADRKRLHYTEATILELLRYSSIAPLANPHCTTVDTTINGYDIPKDTEVFFNLWKLHHSAEYWDEPWEFKPERFLDKNNVVVAADHINKRRLMAFGASRRVCLGETLAKNRLFLMVVSLLQHFEFLPAGPDGIPRHDPRDYKATFGIEPHKYRVRLVPRQ